MPTGQRPETVLAGIGVFHSIAIGPAYLVQVEQPRTPERKISKDEVAAEQQRFQGAVNKARAEITALKERRDDAAEEVTLLLDAHLAMLSGSRLVRSAAKLIETDLINAEAAVVRVMRELEEQFLALKDRYIAARIDDIMAVGNRLVRILLDLPYISLDSVPAGGIVLAKEISPADAALLDPARLAGLATVHGGAAGHTAVIARSMGLAAVLGVDAALLDNTCHGQTVIIDGIEGKVILHPSDSTLKKYEEKKKKLQKDGEGLQQLTALSAVTKDGVEIILRANLDLPGELPALKTAGARGIGLFRTEFLYMNRATLPTEEEQFDAYAGIVGEMEGESVTFRTLDIGGDKLAKSVGEYLGEADNPALGLRAIRLSLKEPHLLRAQFRAMIRAGTLGPVKILLPMVTTADEVEQARKILKECYDALKKEKFPVPAKLPPLGTMIEIPAAALSADSLAAVSDFFALGTNDLVQYTVAIDRGNDQVAALYNPLNPAVLRLMEFAIEAARRADIPVSLCGEMGADPKYTALLMGLGVREFSVGYAGIPRIKQRIRALTLEKAQEHAHHVMRQFEPAKIIQIVNQFRA